MNASTLGIDLGERRIGVALAGASTTLAMPLQVIHRSGSTRRDHQEIAKLVCEYEAGLVVVGLPISLDGSVGPAAVAATAEAAQLEAVLQEANLEVSVVTHDERLTTVMAERLLASAGLSGKARRKKVDMVAASVILQSWLDSVESDSVQSRAEQS
ncbi:MAG: Holliday junction resolvase RuvX [bacterium]|nr:Holliday junction resolvase RuvX [bacterium]MCY4257176.1 Holliday junction resolvase RuvX [bacterium]